MTEIIKVKEKKTFEVEDILAKFGTSYYEAAYKIYLSKDATYKIYPSKIEITVCDDKNNPMTLSIANQSELDTQEKNIIKDLNTKLELRKKEIPTDDPLIQAILNSRNIWRRVFQVLKANEYVKQLKK